MSKQTTYKDAGVNIDVANQLVHDLKTITKATARPGAHAHLGSFGGIFDLAKLNYRDPLLVSTTDGVGTKLKIAQQVDKHDTIGIDLVAMCVNDLLVHGAQPLFFLDYFSTGKLDPIQARTIIASVANGCKLAGSALIGGETAEMPGMYANGEYDLAGFAVGIVERENLLPKKNIEVGDVVIGFASSGIHANGFSLIRHLITKNKIDIYKKPPFVSLCNFLYEELLQPTTIYVKQLQPLLDKKYIKALAHITGGGLLENIPRILPENKSVTIDSSSLHSPKIFAWLQKLGNIAPHEMYRTFNMGIGMVAIVSSSEVHKILNLKKEIQIIGNVVEKNNENKKVTII